MQYPPLEAKVMAEEVRLPAEEIRPRICDRGAFILSLSHISGHSLSSILYNSGGLSAMLENTE